MKIESTVTKTKKIYYKNLDGPENDCWLSLNQCWRWLRCRAFFPSINQVKWAPDLSGLNMWDFQFNTLIQWAQTKGEYCVVRTVWSDNWVAALGRTANNLDFNWNEKRLERCDIFKMWSNPWNVMVRKSAVHQECYASDSFSNIFWQNLPKWLILVSQAFPSEHYSSSIQIGIIIDSFRPNKL